ncbi:DUF6452 family protein [Fulvivirga lutimaris]|uniref:DUF6452 family protein n=1 Tax=Fulvivirga lutimaris TaxID=1819566 RepID=UPI0012BCA68A|nr:hypothetical protein [Fulvivirga lutimaris]MTI41775.1 hypothetical protein [Fulvivirga lutimaris]
MRKITGILFLAYLFLVGCNDPDCIRLASTTMGIGFYDINTGDAMAIRVNKLQVVGIEAALLENIESTNNVLLPINPSDTSIAAVFDTEFGVDTLIISYNTVTRLISEECGAEIMIENLRKVRNDFDSIRFVNRSLQITLGESNVVTENVKIFN